ncbi:MAG: hypothetical protein AOA65_2177 [Candidatus Bathyarchaeota archaeon BA1]|nr:MAG: hypothetical protein AOA65_2177 [Candidatus Bathyarchaeota archaeon BA1]
MLTWYFVIPDSDISSIPVFGCFGGCYHKCGPLHALVLLARENHDNAFKAKVTHMELLGRELNIHLTARDKKLVLVTEPARRLEGEVWVTFDENKIYLFDGRKGELVV